MEPKRIRRKSSFHFTSLETDESVDEQKNLCIVQFQNISQELSGQKKSAKCVIRLNRLSCSRIDRSIFDI